MLNHNKSNLLKKEEALIECFSSLASSNAIDGSPEEATAIFYDALQAILSYPDIQGLKRMVLKAGSIDSYVVIIEENLRLCVAGKGTAPILRAIYTALDDALDAVQLEIEALEGS